MPCGGEGPHRPSTCPSQSVTSMWHTFCSTRAVGSMPCRTEGISCLEMNATCAHDKESIMHKYLHSLAALGLAGVLFAAAITVQRAVFVRVALPPPQAEVVCPPPVPGHAWTGGHYHWDGREYV